MFFRTNWTEEKFDARGGVSFLSTDTLESWSAMIKEEVNELVDTCAALDTVNLMMDAAKRKRKDFPGERDAYRFILHTYIGYGKFVIHNLELKNISKICDTVAEINYQSYIDKNQDYPVSDVFAKNTTIEELLKYYAKFFLMRVDGAIEKEYDWDVIQRMLRDELTQERFTKLKNDFSDS